MTTAIHPWPAGEWRRLLADAVSDLDELLEMLDLDGTALAIDPTSAAARRFPLRVPRGFVARMRPSDPDDPLLRQVLPLAAEDDQIPGFTNDPVGELGPARSGGMLHKYRGRALLVATGSCAMHCRYCFRRHFPYDHRPRDGRWTDALESIAVDESITEVILSGGDPLVLDDRALADFVQELTAISHIRRLRLHTRMPVVLPERVDESLITWLGACRLPVTVVIHANHPREVCDNTARALTVLGASGATLLNQAVLLAGVNDDTSVLAELSDRLFECGVLPYYLHLLDRVAGSAHFEVDEDRALEIVADLRARLPGYLVPRLVRELPGAPSKVVLG